MNLNWYIKYEFNSEQQNIGKYLYNSCGIFSSYVESERVRLLKVKHSFLLLIGLLVTLPFRSEAFDTGIDGLYINGYGTVGLLYNDSDNILYRNSIEQDGVEHGFDWGTDSNLGLQLDYIFNQQLSMTTQFLFIDRPDNSFNKTLKSAFLSYQINDAFELSIGRIANDIFMSSEYKNVGFARLWAHQPVEFYGQIAGDSYDGLQLKHHLRLGNGVLTSSLWGGRSRFPYVSNNESKEVIFEPNYGLSLRWENQAWLLRLLYSQARINDHEDGIAALDNALLFASQNGWPEAASVAGFSINDTWLRYLATGFSYDKNNWLVQSEISFVKAETKLQNKYAAAYLSVGHRFGSITPYFILSQFKTIGGRDKIPDAPAFIPVYQQLQAITQSVTNASYSDQSTFAIGARWDVSAKVSLKAQWDRTRVNKYGDFIFERQNQIDKQHIFNIFSVTMDFVF